MATLTPEGVTARFTELENQHNTLLGRMANLEGEHQRVHAELATSKAHLTQARQEVAALQLKTNKLEGDVAAGNGGRGGFQFRLIDLKAMVLEKLAGRNQWQAWSEATRS